MPDDDEDVVEIRPAGTDATDVARALAAVHQGARAQDRSRTGCTSTSTTTDSDQETELQRLLVLGATRVDVGQGDVHWHVLADPEGNEFCLLRSVVEAF